MLPQEIDKFGDRPGRVAYGEKDVRVIVPMDEAHDEPAVDSKRGLPESKARVVGKIPRFLRNR
jgi:hypothetical protein